MSATEAQIKAVLAKSTRDWDQECQALAWNICNWFGTAPKSYLSANEAYHASKIVSKDPTKAPTGSFHYWNIGVYGHVAIGLGGERVLMASAHIAHSWGTHVGDQLVSKYNAITGAQYLGWSLTNGANDFTLDPPKPAVVKLKPTQRKARAVTNSRDLPTTKSKVISNIQKDRVGNFQAWTHGEKITQDTISTDVWFQGTSGNWFWAGGFTDHGTTGLKQIANPTPKPAVAVPVKATPAPVAPQPVKTPAHDISKDAENVIPHKVADNQALDYTFDKDLACVTQVVPVPWENFDQTKPFPTDPKKAVIHQFGTPGTDTFQSTLNWFTNPAAETSSHFVVSGKHIVQTVSIKDRAWHAGPAGNDFIGIETDPAQDADTIASVRTLLEQLAAHYGHILEPVKHSSLASTACGQLIDLNNYQIEPPAPEPTEATPSGHPEPVPTPVQSSTPSVKEQLIGQVRIIAAEFDTLLKMLAEE